MSSTRFHLAGSGRPNAKAVARAVKAGDQLTATIYLQRDPASKTIPTARALGRLTPAARTYVTPEQAVAVFGAAQSDLDLVVGFAAAHKLTVVERSIRKRLVRVKGKAKQMEAAFGVELRHYEHPRGGTYRSYEGELQLPVELAGVVEGVLGLDNRKMISTRPRPSRHATEPPAAFTGPPPNAYTPPMLARLFDFPEGDGADQCVAVFAFNGEVMSTGQKASGGYDRGAVESYFTETLKQATPELVDVVVQGPGNEPGNGEGDDVTGEVLLDLCTVGGVVPGAKIAVYFTEFTEEGWVNAIKAALADMTHKPKVISISYGNPEDDETRGLWTEEAVKLVNSAFEQAVARGITICCASGDDGSADESEGSAPHVDFPASSPWVLACGGTRLEADATTGKVKAEKVWNDLAEGHGATGGGISRLFPVPEWQAAAGVPANADGTSGAGRGVPDVASLADPETPMWVLTPGGELGGIGGTSAAAPLWAGLVALLNQRTGAPLGYCNPQLYSFLRDALVDITKGGNGSYKAAKGWDPCTGWGRPDGQLLAKALAGPPPSPPVEGGNAETATQPKEAPSETTSVPGLTQNLIGPEGQLFADPQPSEDESAFQIDNTSDQYYKSVYYEGHQNLLQPVPAPRVAPPRMTLAQVVGAAPLAPYEAARRIVFHAVGDTGPSSETHVKTAAGVADAMAAELKAAPPGSAPAFLFHLGDVVYNFGEHQYYYDQFYEPFRAYDAPIFAIPGNHDGFPSEESENEDPLFAFLRNFCAATPGTKSPDSGGLVRTAMNQPGVYFTLDAPFVSIVGLYSNVLEGPGVISSEGGRYPSMDDYQLAFLTSELLRLKPEREANERAVILACHHPPLSADERHGGARGLAEDIDKASQEAGLRPDVVLSGHAHLYQRFTRTVEGAEIPYIVSGSGGHNATKPKPDAKEKALPEGYALTVSPLVEYGYLTLTVDMSTKAPKLAVAFNQTSGKPQQGDSVTVDLAKRKIVK